jgi:hypothetical protein
VQTLYEKSRFTRPMSFRFEYKQYQDLARTTVDEATWHEAWARGETMSTEEALQYASQSLKLIDANSDNR